MKFFFYALMISISYCLYPANNTHPGVSLARYKKRAFYNNSKDRKYYIDYALSKIVSVGPKGEITYLLNRNIRKGIPFYKKGGRRFLLPKNKSNMDKNLVGIGSVNIIKNKNGVCSGLMDKIIDNIKYATVKGLPEVAIEYEQGALGKSFRGIFFENDLLKEAIHRACLRYIIYARRKRVEILNKIEQFFGLFKSDERNKIIDALVCYPEVYKHEFNKKILENLKVAQLIKNEVDTDSLSVEHIVKIIRSYNA